MTRENPFEANWLPLAFGSLPYLDATQGWDVLKRTCPELLGWPQLPRRSYLENMYVQCSERFPALVLAEDSASVDRRRGFDRGLEQLYLAYLENDLAYGQISAAYAEALDALLRDEVELPRSVLALRGQIIGPVSWGLNLVDQNQQPILYDQLLEDAVGKHLRLKAAWQEQQLARFAPQTIMMVEEPYMASFGSRFVSLTRQQVVALLEEVFSGLQGIKGLHCCGNTDWSVVLQTSVDMISLDAYDYALTLVRHAEAIARFLARGGIIAWGIVPAGSAAEIDTVDSLVFRLEEAIERLAEAGVDRRDILGAGLVTPSCNLGSLSPELATRVLDLTADVSKEMRRRYVGSTA